MIQSVKFDSSNMDIKKIANTILSFIVKRLIEISGIAVSILGILLLIALISYSPSDPNFIFPENTEIENLLGFRGSYISDLFFQSIGLISYLISITFIFTGISIFKVKSFFLIIENIFYTIPYCLVGSLCLSYFYKDTFELYINGNGGFIGKYFGQTFLASIITTNEDIFYYILILLILTLFLFSINVSPKKLILDIKKILNFFLNNENKNYTNKNEIINE